MHGRVLNIFREKVAKREYIVTLHADEEMSDDAINILDVENCVATGNITERQTDLITAEKKYRIHGKTMDGEKMELIVKLSPTGKMVIITAYLLT